MLGILAAAAYGLTIPLANWAIVTFGLVPVGFGLVAPAGAFAAGFAFLFRDLVQETAGPRATTRVAALILVGAGCSMLVAPAQIALASGLAFLVSELADWCVYTPLRRRGLVVAMLASNAVGLVIDSALFLGLAFGSQEFLAGQVVAKTMTLVPAAVLMWWLRSAGHVRQPAAA